MNFSIEELETIASALAVETARYSKMSNDANVLTLTPLVVANIRKKVRSCGELNRRVAAFLKENAKRKGKKTAAA